MENIIQLILQKLDKPYDYIAKAKFGKSPQILLGDFLKIVITNNVGSHNSKKYLGIAAQTFNRLVKRVFPTTKLNGGGETWSFYLLQLVGYKKCHKCNNILLNQEFYTGVASCKTCYSVKNKQYYENRKDVWDTYYNEHKSDYLARNAQRRAVTKQATPTWADLSKIKRIYAKCPVGYHVDHIIPLNNPTVCGLHVENNLKKSNKFE